MNTRCLLLFASLTILARVLAATDPAQLAAARELLKPGTGKSAVAQKAFEAIAAADPQNAEAQDALAQLALRRDDAEKAVAYAEKATTLAPDTASYFDTLGDAYGVSAQKAGVFSKFGLAKKCLAAYQRAVALAPDNVDCHLNLFEYYRQAPGIAGGGSDKAEAEAAIITKLDPVRGHTTYISLYSGDKKYDQAYVHAAELKKLDVNRGRLAYAGLYTETKQYDKALAEFDDALKTAPDDYSANYQIGRLAANTGQFLDRGLAALRHCLDLTPTSTAQSHAAVQWRIGNILEKKNDPASARAAYEASLKLDSKFPQSIEALKKLK